MALLRVAVVGLGVGERHLVAYRDSGECEVVAVCDLSEEKLAHARTCYPGIRLTRNAAEILADPAIDAVSIASFDDAHAGQVVAALDAGKHVFVEKPLCQTADELRAIKHAWAKHGGKLKLSSNLVLRAAPLYRWLRDRVREGTFGEVYAFDGDYLYGRLEKITHGWRKDVPNYSVMAGGGIHLIDLLLWVTGQRPNSVAAVGNSICTRDSDFRYPDFMAATFQFPPGLVARITANFGCVHRHQHVIRLFGTSATFIYDDAGPRLHMTRDPGVSASPVTLAPLPATKGELIGDFVRAIREGRDLTSETQTHFDVMSVVCACAESLQTGAPKEIGEP